MSLGKEIEIREFERVRRAAIERFSGVPASIAANLSDRRMGLHHSIRRFCGSGVAVGSALTARAPCGDNLALHVALAEAKAGDVVVLATGNCDECAVVGDRLATIAASKDVAAIVTDGLARDLRMMRAIGIPVYCRGLSPCSPLVTGPAKVGCRLDIGGLIIDAGDLIVADDDGIAVIPRENLADAEVALEEKLRQERRADELRTGTVRAAWLDHALATARRISANTDQQDE